MLMDALQIPAALALMVLAVRTPFKGRTAVGAAGVLLLVPAVLRLVPSLDDYYPTVRLISTIGLLGLGANFVRLMSPEARRAGAPAALLSIGVMLGLGGLALMSGGQAPKSLQTVVAGAVGVMGVGALFSLVRFLVRDRASSPR